MRQPFGVLEMLGKSLPAWLRVQEGKREHRVPLSSISRARLDVEF